MGDDALQVEPIKVYENTYLKAPLESQQFRRFEAQAIMKKVLEDKMAVVNERDKKGRLSWMYDPEDAGDIIREIVTDCQANLLAAMKERQHGAPPVYKFIFQAQIGENNGQMIRSASRCLWEKEKDNSATATWTNGRVWAVAMCFALYYS
ncbi:hypothetical protein AB1Y20_023717 [Prymnesium parvum]|uniref:Dynein light chain n=1 Tax=Prymnesium parvum TaxID=97485 RepID=A0AB34JGN4_PRYPA